MRFVAAHTHNPPQAGIPARFFFIWLEDLGIEKAPCNLHSAFGLFKPIYFYLSAFRFAAVVDFNAHTLPLNEWFIINPSICNEPQNYLALLF